jgi:hypothetical protein
MVCADSGSDAFKSKVQESGRSIGNLDTKVFFNTTGSAIAPPSAPVTFVAPPRLVSDQMINVFFQEWAPLFPIFHRPTFLQLYADYVTDPGSITDRQSLAQLNLVFGLAALSSEVQTDQTPPSSLGERNPLTLMQSNKEHLHVFESQWQAALNSIICESTLGTLQCLLLAQMYCIARSDYNRLLYYTGISVSLSHRLGLHQSQKRFSFGALTLETRKKVFWTLYTLDW